MFITIIIIIIIIVKNTLVDDNIFHTFLSSEKYSIILHFLTCSEHTHTHTHIYMCVCVCVV